MKPRQDTSAKPYHRCLSCPRFRNTCGGRLTRGMDLHEWCEYMRDVKDIAHLTNAHIAQTADVSLKTIERIMAINCEQDIMRAIARRIELAVIGPVGDHTCCLDYSDGTLIERNKALLQELEHLRKENDRYAKFIDKYLNV